MDREREFKFDLGDEGVTRRLEARLGEPESSRLQVNRFYDSPDRALGRQLWALRLRGEWRLPADAALPPPVAALEAGPPDRVVLSLKGAREGAGPYHDRSERQLVLADDAWRLTELPFEIMPPQWRALLPALGTGAAPAELAEVARFANLRRAFPLPPRWRAEVDRTRFGDGRQAWEIEVEIRPQDEPAPVVTLIENLLGECGILPRPQERSKLERALAGPGGP